MNKLFCAAMLSLLAIGASSCREDAGGNEATVAAANSDPDPAVNSPDETAWRLFVAAVTPTAADGPAAFETWASDGETFRPNATWPTDGGGIEPRTARPTLAVAGHRETAEPPAGIQPDTLHNAASEEVRRNRPAFDYIVGNNLNSVSGLQAAYRNSMAVSFPTESVEVKTNWLPLDQLARYYPAEMAADPARYFYIARDAAGQQHALLSMHVISKEVPNWTWATFEHQATPGRCDIIGCRDSFGAQVAYVAPAASPEGNYGPCAHTDALQALFREAGLSEVFGNYCLKGSQTDFTDATGLAIRLGNSITEGGFVDSSSCMTCHATASWQANGQPSDAAGNAPIGPVPATIYWTGGGTPPYQGGPGLARVSLPADFVWSIPFCAYDDVSRPGQPQPSRCAKK